MIGWLIYAYNRFWGSWGKNYNETFAGEDEWLYAIITWFSDTLTSARPLGVIKTLTFQALVSTSLLGSSRYKSIVNMFDPYIQPSSTILQPLFTKYEIYAIRFQNIIQRTWRFPMRHASISYIKPFRSSPFNHLYYCCYDLAPTGSHGADWDCMAVWTCLSFGSLQSLKWISQFCAKMLLNWTHVIMTLLSSLFHQSGQIHQMSSSQEQKSQWPCAFIICNITSGTLANVVQMLSLNGPCSK